MYIKYNRILNKVYQDEGILEGLSKMLGVQLRQDWIGRIYTVINPYIKDGQYDPQAMITEVGSDVPSEMVIEKFIMERLTAAQTFIRANNLFDLLTYKIDKLDDYDNYLFMMYPIPYYDMMKWGKRFLGLAIVLLITCAILLMIF